MCENLEKIKETCDFAPTQLGNTPKTNLHVSLCFTLFVSFRFGCAVLFLLIPEVCFFTMFSVDRFFILICLPLGIYFDL